MQAIWKLFTVLLRIPNKRIEDAVLIRGLGRLVASSVHCGTSSPEQPENRLDIILRQLASTWCVNFTFVNGF